MKSHDFLTTLTLSIAIGLSGCHDQPRDKVAESVAADSPAPCEQPTYIEEFNEILRSMSGEHNDGVQLNHGWGVFNTI